MNYHRILDCDIANGTGVRVTLFVSGCTNRCQNCFQPQTWDFNSGKPFTEETANQILNLLDRPYISGLTLLGGEPMEPRNQKELVDFVELVREKFPSKTIWCFSGFTLEELLDPEKYCHTTETERFLKLMDVLVDGRFVESQKALNLGFRGSANQRIIDIKNYFHTGEIIEPEM